MLPCFPGVGDGANYRTFGPQGPSASVAQRTGEVHGFFKQRAKGIVSPVPQLKITLSWQPLGPPKFPVPFFKIRDEVAAETGYVFIKLPNSTSWQSWHSSAHACTSSWLTNAERDAPAASVKVVVSASCLRGKRPSASSKLLRYLESQPNDVLSVSSCFFQIHASNLSRK